MTDLTDHEKLLLDFESGPHWTYTGTKEDEIRRRFDLSPTRYYQRLNALILRPDALVYSPVTVKRLLRLREARAARRTPQGRDVTVR